MNIKFILITGVVIAILYFLISPYQNCMRDGDIDGVYPTTQTLFCMTETSW
jgi:hypothetical protein